MQLLVGTTAICHMLCEKDPEHFGKSLLSPLQAVPPNQVEIILAHNPLVVEEIPRLLNSTEIKEGFLR